MPRDMENKRAWTRANRAKRKAEDPEGIAKQEKEARDKFHANNPNYLNEYRKKWLAKGDNEKRYAEYHKAYMKKYNAKRKAKKLQNKVDSDEKKG